MEVNLIPNDEVPKDQLEKDAESLVSKLNLLGVRDVKTIYQNPSDNFDHGAMNIKGNINSSEEDSIRDDAIAFIDESLPDYYGSFEYSDVSEATMASIASGDKELKKLKALSAPIVRVNMKLATFKNQWNYITKDMEIIIHDKPSKEFTEVAEWLSGDGIDGIVGDLDEITDLLKRI